MSTSELQRVVMLGLMLVVGACGRGRAAEPTTPQSEASGGADSASPQSQADEQDRASGEPADERWDETVDASDYYEGGKERATELYEASKEKVSAAYEASKDKAAELYHKAKDALAPAAEYVGEKTKSALRRGKQALSEAVEAWAEEEE